MDDKFLVCVRCFTFNHAPYIKDALDGFCMQETNFPFVCTIVDDASTDGEQEVIRNYLEEHFDMENNAIARKEETNDYFLAYARHKTNINCYFVVVYLKYNHNGTSEMKNRKFQYISEWLHSVKYIALCEGDDYWINPHKLQIQIGYLENHEDCGMCYTRFDIFLSDENVFLHDVIDTLPNRYKIVEDDLASWIEKTPYVAPMSWVARTNLWFNAPNIPSSDGTFIYFANFINRGKVHCVEGAPMVIYRVVQESASHTISPTKRYNYKKRLFYSQLLLADYYKELIYDNIGLKERITRKYYKRNLLLILLNKDNDELRKCVDALGDMISIIQKIQILFLSLNIINNIFYYLYEHKRSIRKMFHVETALLKEYKLSIYKNKDKFPQYYKELINR